ncbi:MAG: helix-turn-helix domain-containing protein [Streptosporangiaceae bacterium]
MEQTKPLTPTQVVAARMLALRKKRGWSAAELARRMKAAGIPWERIVVTKLENGHRASVSVDELVALAAVLNCPLVMLLTTDETAPYQVTPTTITWMFGARGWMRGAGPLADADTRDYYAELPRGESFTPGHMTSDGEAWVGPVQQGPPMRLEDRDG